MGSDSATNNNTNSLLVWFILHAPYLSLRGVCRLLGDYWYPVTENGTFRLRAIVFRVNGALHRLHGPAITWEDGATHWFKDGERHRDGDSPAITTMYGTRTWYKHGKIHRDGDLPAEIHINGDSSWYKHGKLHRDGGLPAVELEDGTKEWWIHGERTK